MERTNHAAKSDLTSVVGWRQELSRKHWMTFIAAFLGWALDIMDFMLYAYVIVSVMKDLHISTASAGTLASAALVSSAFGGLIFGVVGDKYGRIKSMTISIAVYTVATFLCGLSPNFMFLLIFRVFVGLGMGGEYGAGAALVTETWPTKYRAKAMAMVQSGFTFGLILATIISMTVLPHWGWRAVFFIGIVPALLIFWIRRHTPESELWQKNRQKIDFEKRKNAALAIFRQLVSQQYSRKTIISLLYVTCIMLGFWGLTTWAPAYLTLPVAKGGRGLSIIKSGGYIILTYVASFLGYLTFGTVTDKIGLKVTNIIWIFGLVLSVPFFLTVSSPLGLAIATLSYGYFASVYGGIGLIMAQLFPTEIRATATGAIYNIARALSGFAPIVIGKIAVTIGLDRALLLVVGFYAFSLLFFLLLPNINQTELE